MLSLTVVLLAFAVSAQAVSFAQYVGYTIAGAKYIKGYVTKDGEFKTQFDGCDFGRQIVFDDGTYLTCTQYGYHYAYHPEAVLLVRHGEWVMIVDDKAYDMRN
jgi:hypothetical protein